MSCEIIFIQHASAALFPSSKLISEPTFPFIRFPLASKEICADIYKKFPTFLKAVYKPTGAGAFGNTIFRFSPFSNFLP